jgi:predicted GH43/DUF377 family glycosyl hydrolase
MVSLGAPGAFDDEQVAEPRVLNLGSSYRMNYTGANASSQRKSLGIATSLDGIAWMKDNRSPLLDTTRWGSFWGGAFFNEGGAWHLWHASDQGAGQINYKWSLDGIAWIDGALTPVLAVSSVANGPDSTSLGDSVSGYRNDSEYRILYTGYAPNLFGSLGRIEGINMANVAATCP